MAFHTISFHFITCMGSVPMCIRINKIDGFIITFKLKKVVLQVVIIIVLQGSELIHIILYI